MGIFFKTKEEREEIRKRKELQAQEDRRKIRESSVTEAIREHLEKEFTGQGRGEILGEFRSCNFAVLKVYRGGVSIRIFHRRKKEDGSETTLYGIVNFESIGYANLNSVMVNELKNVIFKVLTNLNCMKVTDQSVDELFLYPVKQAW